MILGRSAAATRIQTFASTAAPPSSRQGTPPQCLAARGAVAVGENAGHVVETIVMEMIVVEVMIALHHGAAATRTIVEGNPICKPPKNTRKSLTNDHVSSIQWSTSQA